MQSEITFPTSSTINVEKLTEQNKSVYDYLCTHDFIDRIIALDMGIYSLHSRISDLSNKHGILIHRRSKVSVGGTVIKEYSLSPYKK
jgi:hypothetical protein